jgi:hypothetical protein
VLNICSVAICAMLVATTVATAFAQDTGTGPSPTPAPLSASDSGRAENPSPLGPNATTLTSTVTPDLFTGNLGTAISLNLGASRGKAILGLNPTYRANLKVSWIGVGWFMDAPSIGLDLTDRTALSRGKVFKFGHEARSEITSSDGKLFRRIVEVDYSKYEKFTTGSDDFWVETLRDGTRLYYGESASSRIVGDTQTAANSTVRWYLTKIVDVSGNFATIDYVARGDLNYISKVSLSGHQDSNGRVDVSPIWISTFSVEDRPDVSEYFSLGRRRTLDKRLAKIEVVANKVTQRTYNFVYDLSTVTNRSLLSKLGLEGKNGLAVPPTEFDYVKSPEQYKSAERVLSVSANPWGTEQLRWTGLAASLLNFADLRGDAAPAFCAPEADKVLCWRQSLLTLSPLPFQMLLSPSVDSTTR